MVDESLTETLDWKPNRNELMVMFVLGMVSLMVSLDATVIVTSLSSMVEDLKGTTTQGIWVGTAYLLSQAVAMPVLSSLSDIFGRPILLIFSILMFTAGSLICVTSDTISQLLAGRAVQGTGGGGVVVISMVVFTDIVPLRYRPKWYGTVQGAWALGTCIGPVIGGAIAQNTTWRWVFYIMFPFCAFGLVAIPLLLTIKARTETIGTKLKRVDWAGSLAFMASATSFLVAISWGGSQFSWSSAATIAPLAAGVAGLLVVAAWERYMAKEPIMPHALFHNVAAIATYACSAAQGLLLFGQLYYIPFYFMAVLAYSPINTGVSMLPVTLTLVPSSIVTGALITRYNNYRWPISVGWAVCTVGCGLLTMWDADTHVAIWVISLMILGFGHGAILNAQGFSAQAICHSGDEASAAAMYAFMRHFGSALGVGIGGTAFQNIMALKLGWLNLPTTIANNAEGFIPQLLAMPAGAEKEAILSAYVFGVKGVFRVYLGIAGVAFLASLLVKHYDMNKELHTEHKLRENHLSRIVGGQFHYHHKSSSSNASVMSTPKGPALVGIAAVAASNETTARNSISMEGGETPLSSGSSCTKWDIQSPPPVALKEKRSRSRSRSRSVSSKSRAASLERPPTARTVMADADANIEPSIEAQDLEGAEHQSETVGVAK
ncbi:major facilitator superfamily domain-containing protein [Coniella lustricola]|uniref:Major facilitator superfamily domain-containing protein n=1 Tax=Coniella lustricola TaxID=2025994 RepID=A0A2T2ZWZ3_9PEZI|nr:major facilitator superfamily domain-containing protein [Coniella lustricola]